MSDNSNFYDSLGRWGTQLDLANQNRIKITNSLIPKDVHSILDVGCGDGTTTNPLVAQGFDISGIDISQKAITHFGGNKIIANGNNIPFLDSSFDLVVSAETLEHLPVGIFEGTLTEIERVARRYIIVTTPNQEYLPAGFTKCGNCGEVFHRNLHQMSFDRKIHEKLFKQFRLVETVGIDRWKHFPLITNLEHRLLGVYGFQPGLYCIKCGQEVKKAQYSLFQKAMFRLFGLIKRVSFYPYKPRWLASVYQRIDI